MKTLVMLCLFVGGFLIMDSICQQKILKARHSVKKKKVKYVPMSIFDEQLSGRSLRNEFTDMFYSSGPWRFRDNAYGISRAGSKDFEDLFAAMQAKRLALAESPEDAPLPNLASEAPPLTPTASTPAERIKRRSQRRREENSAE